jgi:hypothetical protein
MADIGTANFTVLGDNEVHADIKGMSNLALYSVMVAIAQMVMDDPRGPPPDEGLGSNFRDAHAALMRSVTKTVNLAPEGVN